MAQPEVESTGDEAHRPQLQQRTLPQLLLEVPLQRGRLFGQQRLYECTFVYFHAAPKCAPNALAKPAASWLALRVCTCLPVSLPRGVYELSLVLIQTFGWLFMGMLQHGKVRIYFAVEGD